ncbi:biliverdin-producing heme oxygenase [Glaciecola sp. MH2013]|uniref:biliverdin-producing heme oxygenase n=1 Tax=Glaciecola sp. MH2013 TaxID=2785524 RepID=UPI00189C7951|nr:biliverdin-producing heme oxygenase [Glaciecola sp. MH2013]MBF7073554.1 biliverdin-producing heme oxygenase [Glaciecola sp. MH2013]
MNYFNTTHQRLKTDTHSAHTALDSSPLLRSLMETTLTIESYIAVMQIMHKWFAAAESTHLHEYFNHSSLPLIKVKTGLLEADLQELGGTTLPKLALAKKTASRHFSLGVLYVAEGSSLGGMIIGKKVKKTLGLQKATRFYDCYGHQKIDSFRTTINYIHSLCATEEHYQQVLAGALDSFSALRALCNKKVVTQEELVS